MATLQFKSLTKNGKGALYTGLRTIQRFALGQFTNKTPPQAIEVEGDFAGARIAESKEDRKARLAALPKLTLAEKVAKREAQLEKMKAKLASQ